MNYHGYRHGWSKPATCTCTCIHTCCTLYYVHTPLDFLLIIVSNPFIHFCIKSRRLRFQITNELQSLDLDQLYPGFNNTLYYNNITMIINTLQSFIILHIVCTNNKAHSTSMYMYMYMYIQFSRLTILYNVLHYTFVIIIIVHVHVHLATVHVGCYSAMIRLG